jgi:predicted DNA-binding transcriptional regulator AlpA
MSSSQPFTTLAISGRMSVLRGIVSLLKEKPIDSREDFSDMMKAVFGYCIFDFRPLSDDLGFSMSSVYRWIDGKTAPHPAVWPTIVAWVVAMLERQIEESEKTQGEAS